MKIIQIYCWHTAHFIKSYNKPKDNMKPIPSTSAMKVRRNPKIKKGAYGDKRKRDRVYGAPCPLL